LAAAPSAVHGTNDSAEGGGGIGSEAAGFAAWCASGQPSVSAAEREEWEERSPGERERPGGESARSDAGERDREEYGVAGGEGYGERRGEKLGSDCDSHFHELRLEAGRAHLYGGRDEACPVCTKGGGGAACGWDPRLSTGGGGSYQRVIRPLQM